MKVTILGYGSVGQKLARLFSDGGHEVFIGMPRPATAAAMSNWYGTFEEAVDKGEVIVLALPFAACQEVLPRLAQALGGKIVVDSTNPVNADWSPLLLGQENSAAEEISRLLPNARVVKAFNTIFADVMQPARQERGNLRITAFVSSDDADARQKVCQLAKDSGFAPVDVGALRAARHLEAMAHLNIHIALNQNGGTNAAFIYHQA
jgi:8-hydroxy-5-deazaflavin:NADPH oxidoreductase